MATQYGFGVELSNQGLMIPIILSGIIKRQILTQQPIATQPATQTISPLFIGPTL